MATTQTSGFLSLNLKDFAKGAILAVITPVLTVIYNSLQAGSFSLDWKAVGITAATTFIAYLLKNLLTPAQVVTPVKDLIKE